MSNTLSIDLLAPRYEVIADYPGSPNKGTIFSGKNKVLPNLFYDEDEDGDLFERNILDKYPHIFKPLHWWEKREKVQLPEYVKNNKVVIKITVGNDMTESGSAWMFEKSPDGLRHRLDLKFYAPATEQEYTEYLKSKS